MCIPEKQFTVTPIQTTASFRADQTFCQRGIVINRQQLVLKFVQKPIRKYAYNNDIQELSVNFYRDNKCQLVIVISVCHSILLLEKKEKRAANDGSAVF